MLRSGRFVLFCSLLLFLTMEESSHASGPSFEAPVPTEEWLRPSSSEQELLRGVHLFVFGEAKVEPGFTTTLPLGAKGAAVRVQSVEVLSGRADAVLELGRELRGVLLQAPGKISGIAKEGRLSMTVDDEEVVIAAISGRAMVGRAGGFVPLEAGMVRVFSRKTGRSHEEKLPDAPELKSEEGLRVVLSGKVRAQVGSLRQAPLRLAVVDSQGQRVAETETRAARGVEFTLPGPGRYFVYARELGPGGIEGRLSKALKLQILGLAPGQKLPENGTFLLDRGERVALAGTEDLEIRYGASSIFVPAPPTIGLSRQEVTKVEFRDPKDPATTTILQLAPRVLETKIQFDSPRASWPGKSVGIRVVLKDGLGRMMDLEHELRISTQVNMTKISPQWTMTKKGLLAKIPSQPGKGPWVIRVKILDKNGLAIAREHLEVAPR